MKLLMKALMSDAGMRQHAKELPKYVQKIIADIQGMDDDLMNSLVEIEFDELSTLKEARDFLSREVSCNIEVYSADNPEYDPEGKSRLASPMRPAIYLE